VLPFPRRGIALAASPPMTDSSIPFARDPESGPPVSRGRLGALLWIACETMVFAGLVGTFILARFSAPMWPAPYMDGGVQVLPKKVGLLIPVVNAVVLTLATLYALRASRAAREGNEAQVRAALKRVSLFGVAFLALVFAELKIEGDRGLSLQAGIYGSFIILITMVHAIHVLAGLVWHWVILRRPLTLPLGEVNRDRIEVVTLWWGYVTVVWYLLLGLLHFV